MRFEAPGDGLAVPGTWPEKISVVLGAHRSGTSLATALLNHIGFRLGPAETLMPANQFNPVGYFEQIPVADLNDSILADLGGSWSCPPRNFEVEFAAGLLEQRVARTLSRLFSDRLQDSPCVIKDPRIAVLAPAWRAVIDSSELIVLCRRNPFAVARSLMVRNNIPLRVGLAHWERHLVGSLAAVAGRRVLVFDYDAICDSPAAATEFLVNATAEAGLEVSELDAHRVALSLFDGGLNHAHDFLTVSTDELAPSQAALWEWLKGLPVGLCAIGGAGNFSSDHSEHVLRGYAGSLSLRTNGRLISEAAPAVAHLAKITDSSTAVDLRDASNGGRIESSSTDNDVHADHVLHRGSAVHPSPLVSIIILVLEETDMVQRSLDAVARNVAAKVDHETIVVANGTSYEALLPLQHRGDIVLVRSAVNRGFAGGCNLGAQHARGQYLVLLNDDAEVEPGWLEYLLESVNRDGVGAVGSRVLLGDGRLQESGSVIFSDASTRGVGRGLPVESSRHTAVRDVDYASACSLLIAREAWDAVGGMDERYFPAYYEDVDLCMALREAGLAVIVDPRSQVRHIENGSSSAAYAEFLMLRNRTKFKQKWHARLANHLAPPAAGEVALATRIAGHRAGGSRTRLLIIDDRLPNGAWGSGFGRMMQVIRELATEYEITFLPTGGGNSAVAATLAQMGIEVVWDPAEAHLDEFAGWYEAVLISRPPNFTACVSAVRRFQPDALLVYDVEALWHRRLLRQLEFTDDGEQRSALKREAVSTATTERQIVREADLVVCLSTREFEIVRNWGCLNAALVSPVEPPTHDVGSGFASRSGMLFAGAWAAGPDSPNEDALRFFVREVLPELVTLVPTARLIVTGGSPPASVLALAGPHVTFMGHVSDMAASYEQARVVVVPTRFGSGVKIKTVEAIQHGVPVVSTRIGAEGLHLPATGPVSVVDDPTGFAREIAVLLTDSELWNERRRMALNWSVSTYDGRGEGWLGVLRASIDARRELRQKVRC